LDRCCPGPRGTIKEVLGSQRFCLLHLAGRPARRRPWATDTRRRQWRAARLPYTPTASAARCSSQGACGPTANLCIALSLRQRRAASHIPALLPATFPTLQLLFSAWPSLKHASTLSAARHPTISSRLVQPLINATDLMGGCGAPLVCACKWCRHRLDCRWKRRLRHRAFRWYSVATLPLPLLRSSADTGGSDRPPPLTGSPCPPPRPRRQAALCALCAPTCGAGASEGICW